MWKPFNKKEPQSQYDKFFPQKSLIPTFAYDSGGTVGVMMTLLTFIGLVFVGIGVDYDRYKNGRAQMDSALRGASAGAGTLCRKMLEEKQKENYVIEESEKLFEKLFETSSHSFISSVRVKSGTKPQIKVEFDGKRCKIQSAYEGESDNLISTLLGHKKFYFNGYNKGSTVASSKETITTIIKGPVQIDFLLDVSGSMSTVAEADQRSLIAAVLNDPNNAGGNRSCIYVCHSRFALLGPVASERMINVMDGSPQTVALDWGGPFTLKPPATPSGPLPRKVSTGEGTFVQLGEALDYMGIKVKSDILAEAMGIAITTLKNSPGSAHTKVAFHRFSNSTTGFKTVVPISGDYADITSVSTDPTILKGYFDYLVKCKDASPSLKPAGEALFLPKGDNTLLTGAAMQAKLGPKFCEDVDPDSFITSDGPPNVGFFRNSALWKIKEKLEKLPLNSDSANPIKKVVVLITDGVNTPHLHDMANKTDTRICYEFNNMPHNIKPILMVIHTYYRLQSADGTTSRLVGRVLDSAAEHSLSARHVPLATIASVEQRFNKALAVPFISCTKFYYPAGNGEEIKAAFEKMAAQVQNIIHTAGTEGSGYIEE